MSAMESYDTANNGVVVVVVLMLLLVRTVQRGRTTEKAADGAIQPHTVIEQQMEAAARVVNFIFLINQSVGRYLKTLFKQNGV